MPFIIGLPAGALPSGDAASSSALEGTVLFDLDTLGVCRPALGGRDDDAYLLPHAESLERALESARDCMRSPTEFDSTPKVGRVLAL
jgi:hypothetical protein